MKPSEEDSNKTDNVSLDNNANSGEDVQTLLKELSTKQRELEETNRELFKVRHELEAYHAKYEKIYEYSPTGYFTFDKNGVIVNLNLTGADQLGANKDYLIQKPFIDFITQKIIITSY